MVVGDGLGLEKTVTVVEAMKTLRPIVACLAAAVLISTGAPAPAEASSLAASSRTEPPCRARDLTAADGGTTTFGSRRVTRIELTNNSAAPCSVDGYPQLRFQRLSGLAPFVDLKQTRVDAGYRTAGPHAIALRSLRQASFLLGYRKMKRGGVACVPVSTIDIAFGRGGRLGTLTLPDSITPCGTLDVSPYVTSISPRHAHGATG